MEPILLGVAATALTEGARFLYAQAGEFLNAWRKRRSNPSAAPPQVLEPPANVSVGNARPLSDPPEPSMVDALQELKDLAETIKDGRVDINAPEARAVLADLRRLLEGALRAPIQFGGEPPRPVQISDVHVLVKDVAARVGGVRVNLERLEEAAEIRGVRVEAGEVKTGGDVTGVDLI